MVAQHLVFAAGQVVVIAVAGKLKQHEAANGVVAVPTVVGLGALKLAIAALPPGQAIMLNIVYGFQQQDANARRTQKTEKGKAAKHRHYQGQKQQSGQL